MKKLKTINGYTALSRFISTLKTKPNGDLYIAGYMAHHKMPAEHKYSYAPAYVFHRMTNKDQTAICWIETSHKKYEIWACDKEDYQNLVNENEATQEYLTYKKGEV